MKTRFWHGFLIGLGVGLVLGLMGASYWFYVIAGTVPFIGKIIQGQIRKKTGVQKVADVLENKPEPIERDFQKRRREARRRESENT